MSQAKASLAGERKLDEHLSTSRIFHAETGACQPGRRGKAASTLTSSRGLTAHDGLDDITRDAVVGQHVRVPVQDANAILGIVRLPGRENLIDTV